MESSRSFSLVIYRLCSETCPELNVSHKVVSRSLYYYFEVENVSIESTSGPASRL